MVFSCRVLVPVSIVAICTGIVAVIIAGPWALAYIPLYVLATLPGWPLGRALFGRHPAAWISGALLGYAMTCLALWAVLALHVPSAASFLLAWAVISASTWALVRRSEPLVALPAWSRAGSAYADPAAAARACGVRAAVQESRCERRRRQPFLPRVLHGRFHLAHGAHVRAHQVRHASGQSVPRRPHDSGTTGPISSSPR